MVRVSVTNETTSDSVDTTILKCGQLAGSTYCSRDLKCRIMKKIKNGTTDEK